MAMGSALWAGAQSVCDGAQFALSKASNVLSASRFNRDSFDQARGYDFEEESEYDSENESGDDQWIDVKKEKRDLTKPQEEFMVRSVSESTRQLRLKITKTATEKASAAAGVSFEYAKWALRLVAVEAAHDIGFLTSCKTATDVVRAVKARFPVLEDIQKAYQSGSLEASTSESSAQLTNMTRAHAPQPGIRHPRDVRMASNLDDIPIISDNTINQSPYARDGAPLIHAETGAELELVFEEAGRGRGRKRNTPPHNNSNAQGNTVYSRFIGANHSKGENNA
ncbi:hypothetical protein CB0940_06029 [Cercospora beticola]|uniref:Uncharacterized protein n=1 Tax=Cercospora beticola TaxID=122368 RepID=A0A2G5HX86_CERBT|nr:hypothetical protein CB0940_06029 [Cercospora beticola]PIA97159.1 hypothetical protein CB0940_06029 [Cercospora beticola]WPA98641.1 hypothetical protein RHO25_003254 [Cercospora beticola]